MVLARLVGDGRRIRLVHSFLEYIFNFISWNSSNRESFVRSFIVLHDDAKVFHGATNEVIIFLQLLVFLLLYSS